MAGPAPVEDWDVAELTSMRAAAGELHRAEEVVADIDLVIGWCGKLGHWQALGGAEYDLLLGAAGVLVDEFEHLECRVADFSDVDDVGFRIPFRRGGGRRAAKYDGPARPVSPVNHIANAFPLDVHTRGKHCIRPAHIVLGSRLIVLVDELDLPLFRHQCGNEKDPCGGINALTDDINWKA